MLTSRKMWLGMASAVALAKGDALRIVSHKKQPLSASWKTSDQGLMTPNPNLSQPPSSYLSLLLEL